MKEIKLSRNKIAIVDDEDFEYLSLHKWHVQSKNEINFYAARAKIENGKQVFVFMHREIVKCDQQYVVDHIDGNSLNNIKENLRICTKQQNSCNRRIHKTNSTGYKGVYIHKSGRIAAKITYLGKQYHLGYFDDAKIAHEAYCKAAIKLHGEYASF